MTFVVCHPMLHSDPGKLDKRRMASRVTAWKQAEKKKKARHVRAGRCRCGPQPGRGKKFSLSLPTALLGQFKDVDGAHGLVGGVTVH